MSQPLHNSADLKVSSSGAGQPCSRPWHHYHHHIVWDATVWVLFLAPPIIQLLLGFFTRWQRLLGLTGVPGLIAGCVRAFSAPDDRALRVSAPSTDLPARVLLRGLTVQGLFTVLTLPTLKWQAACFFPFFYSLSLFSTTLRRSIPIVVIATDLLVTAPLLWNTYPESYWQILGISLTEIPTIIAHVALELRGRRIATGRGLALVSQRKAFGYNVHDILGHSLAVLALKAEVARRFIGRDPAAAPWELDEVITLTRRTLADVRSTMTCLRSPDLDSQMEVTRTALSATRICLDMTGSAQDIPERQRALVTWALREATMNVVRHMQTAIVTVHLEPGLLWVSDDGVGLASDQPGNGSAGLRFRCE